MQPGSNWYGADILAERLLAPLTSFLSPASDLYWIYFLTTAAIAGGLYWHRRPGPMTARHFLQWLCPRDIYTHPSAKLDWLIFACNGILFAAPTLGVAAMVAAVTKSFCEVLFGGSPPIFSEGSFTNVGLTLTLVLAGDFAMFLVHYWMHKSRLMWEFHKVHHSALVLMPITAYRQHPVEELMTGAVNGISIGLIGGVFLYFSPANVMPIDLAGHNAIEFFFILAARHLRHSHIRLSFGNALEHWFISPSQHQVHHSIAPRHRDKNLGQIFAFWDWMFGTLYLSRDGSENITYGIDGLAEHKFPGLKEIYIGPFREILQQVRAGSA